MYIVEKFFDTAIIISYLITLEDGYPITGIADYQSKIIDKNLQINILLKFSTFNQKLSYSK